jgi:hypothetical protein
MHQLSQMQKSTASFEVMPTTGWFGWFSLMSAAQ